MRTTHVIVGAMSLCALIAGAAAAGALERQPPFNEELPGAGAPIDRGPGFAVAPRRFGPAMRTFAASPMTASTVSGGPDAHLKGAFGAPIAWPIVAIHSVLLPDRRVLTFGTDERGKQGAKMVYDIWDPALGTASEAHLVLPNATLTDIFCSGQTLLATTGEVVMTGGNTSYGGMPNRSLNSLSVFRPATNTMVAGSPMAYRRWYPTTLALPSGEVLVVGGREDHGDPATTPEILTRSGAWRSLPGATSDAAFGAGVGNGPKPWFYPRAFVAPSGDVLVLGHDGAMFRVTYGGLGGVTKLPVKTLAGNAALPAVTFAPGKVLALRNARQAVVLDLNGTNPKVTRTSGFARARDLASATVLADGKVAVTGGSRVYNQLVDVAYGVETWDPVTGRWSTGASAQKPRLYHSSALLLPDATVLTVGGGAPGPVLNLNAEIYHPPYLFARDGSGTLAPRPSIATAPDTLQLGTVFAVAVNAGTQIGRVTLVRHGSSTHGVNVDQRFLNLKFTQTGNLLAVTAPADARRAIPGYYMLFVFDRVGVPSVARIVRVPVPA